MNLYIVRHGESMSNIGASDSLDSPLSDEGKRQAELLGIAMQNIKFDKIYSSHLIRAVQTAAGVLKHQKNPPALEIVPELAECGYPPQASADEDIIRGIWQDVFFHGKSMMDFESDYDRAVYCIDSIVKKNAYHSGFDSVRESVDGVEKSRDINMLIVTHGRYNAYLLGLLVNFPFDVNMIVEQDNTCVNKFTLFTCNDVPRLKFRSYNNTEHLKGIIYT